jgi:hypothetical protein
MPHFYDSASRPLRGALALLHTCRTLRVESIDAMEPLAQASKSALRIELDLTESRKAAVDVFSIDTKVDAEVSRYIDLLFALVCSRTGTKKIDEVCSVLAGARGADEKRAAG